MESAPPPSAPGPPAVTPAGVRLPDFVIIGAAKAGTTTLYRWLGEQPEVFLADPKEPVFFSREWHRGLGWYGELFRGARVDQRAGEASTAYTDPDHAEAAERMAATVPDARLVYSVRHPEERLRSHHRDRRRRGVETKALLPAIAADPGRYLGRSKYFERLQPFLACFPREQVLVVRFEDLVDPQGTAWARVLDHLGLPPRPAPSTKANVTAESTAVSPLLVRMAQLRKDRQWRVPAFAKQAVRRALSRDRPADRLLAESRAPLPAEIVDPLWDDAARLAEFLGAGAPLWERTPPDA